MAHLREMPCTFASLYSHWLRGPCSQLAEEEAYCSLTPNHTNLSPFIYLVFFIVCLWRQLFKGINHYPLANTMGFGSNRELQQPRRRRRQQKPHKFAYLTMKNSIFRTLCTCILHFVDVLVLSAT
mgnify:CR=1 FL=1